MPVGDAACGCCSWDGGDGGGYCKSSCDDELLEVEFSFDVVLFSTFVYVAFAAAAAAAAVASLNFSSSSGASALICALCKVFLNVNMSFAGSPVEKNESIIDCGLPRFGLNCLGVFLKQ